MKIRTIVNDLTIDGKQHPKGAKLEVDDKEGKSLVDRGYAREVKGKKTPVVAETKPETEKGGAK